MIVVDTIFEGSGYLSFHKLSLVSKKALILSELF